MSFITKRERVFNEYELCDLPARNEGKLKAYSSCTDARAWSHFCTDKTEHLVEIIKRNNEKCQAKFIPTSVIVDTLMSAKNAEIARLRRRIEEFEQMVAAYDQLDLTCDQKCEIANAHAAIRAANKELDDLCLNLDLSDYTEVVDSEGFQTGKSGGDEARGDDVSQMMSQLSAMRRPMESKCNQVERMSMSCTCDKSTSVHDPRIDELKECIISKDAKLNAMQNTIAVMENDVCEPYCVYAHIYTALEKIFGVLCQNEKYRLYLDLLTSGKNIRCIDIKGKILFKLKVLEKFSMALIAPCSEEFAQAEDNESCACFHAEVISDVPHIENLTITSSKTTEPLMDKKRAQMVADIMDNEEMKELLDKENAPTKSDSDRAEIDLGIEDYNIDAENLNRLKSLQENYDNLMNCYENLKHERDCLKIRCNKYDELEKEFSNLQNRLREYNSLWNEKEHYRKRSEDLDNLKEQYLLLAEETSNLETQLKAESEINSIKSYSIDELRVENVDLEKKLNDAIIAFEKEKNALLCKLKETECQVMCQEQQIKSLTAQIDRLLEADHNKRENTNKYIALIEEIELLKNQIRNLQEALYCSEDEKMQLQQQFQDKLNVINELKMQIEDWKSTFEDTIQRNDCMEKCAAKFQDEIQRLTKENQNLSQDVQEKTNAIGNLLDTLKNKSQEVKNLMDQIDQIRRENRDLMKQLHENRKSYDNSIEALETENKNFYDCLQLERKESQKLLEKVKDYDDIRHRKEDVSRSLDELQAEYNELKDILEKTTKENQRIQNTLENRDHDNTILKKELQRLKDMNSNAEVSLNNLQDEKNQYKTSLELSRRESEILKHELSNFNDLREQLNNLRKSHERLMEEKNKLEDELCDKNNKLKDAMQSIQLCKKGSEELLERIQLSENLKDEYEHLTKNYQALLEENRRLQQELEDKNKNLEYLMQFLSNIRKENQDLLQKSEEVAKLQTELARVKNANDELIKEKNILQSDLDSKSEQFNHLSNALESKIEENNKLIEQNRSLRLSEMAAKSDVTALKNEHETNKITLDAVRRESGTLMKKLKTYENLANEFEKLNNTHELTKQEKERLQKELAKNLEELKNLQDNNNELSRQTQDLLVLNEDLEKTLISTRNELISKSRQPTQSKDVIQEIQNMKKEKLDSQEKIRDLLEKLDEAESIISNLSEDVLARDDKIAILENHINSLEDEIRKLHDNLGHAIGTGEQIKDSCDTLDRNLNKIEAHHSKATHNMKIEIAKLQNDNSELEQLLKATKRRSEDSLRDKNNYASQVSHLRNERDIIITDIKQLEMTCVGDSNLGPERCKTEDVLSSLDNIRRAFAAKNTKSTSLEQTILKVQTSSQFLVNEAKRIVEKEKQKMFNEKEEAIAEKERMEKQMEEMRTKLQGEIDHDKRVIKDLQAEIQNQKLILNKIDASKQDYIKKLKEEMQTLQDMYQNSLKKTSELEDTIKSLSKEKGDTMNILDKIKTQFKEKSKEVEMLKKELEDVKNKKMVNTGVQKGLIDNYITSTSQTDPSIEPHLNENTIIEKASNAEVQKFEDIGLMKIKKPAQDKISTQTIPKQKPMKSINEVQVLTANVEPTIDFVKNSYQKYKIQRLSPGRVEQYSITCLAETSIEDNIISQDDFSHKTDITSLVEPKTRQDAGLIDLYKRQSGYTDSSKFAANGSDMNAQSTSKSRDVMEPKSNETKYQNSNPFTVSTSGVSTNEDLFVIYRDSATTPTEKGIEDKDLWQIKPPLSVGSVTVQQSAHGPEITYEKNKKRVFYPEDDLHQDKGKITIQLPRTGVESSSYNTIPEVNKKSSTFVVLKEKRTRRDPESDNSQSHHRLSRVDANFLLIQNKNALGKAATDEPINIEEPGKFGLQYILDTVQQETGTKTFNTGKSLKKSKSDDIISQTKEFPGSESSVSKNTYKTFADKGILVKVGAAEDYEDKIRYLTQSLENQEKDYRKKIEAIKQQYDSNIKNIIKEHNDGVNSIQGLHEETLHDLMKIHENEVENLRSMSIDAMRKAEKLEKENRLLKMKIPDGSGILDEEPVRMSSPDMKRRRSKCRCRGDTRMLTKTNVEAFNVKPKLRSYGPCTCSLDINISDTIRNIFEQVDVEQRKMAENAYLKYIANKIINGSFDGLDAQELSFLHLKVCKTWKSKLSKEEALQKRIDSLETELINKQRHAQQHIAELDRKVAEERRRLQEVREAVCRPRTETSQERLDKDNVMTSTPLSLSPDTTPLPQGVTEIDFSCNCNVGSCVDMNERRSAGDLRAGLSGVCTRSKRAKPESRAVLAKLDIEERREKKLYTDELPTRLRRAHDRPQRVLKK